MTQYLLLDFDRPSHGIGQVVQSDQNVQPPRDQKNPKQTTTTNQQQQNKTDEQLQLKLNLSYKFRVVFKIVFQRFSKPTTICGGSFRIHSSLRK